MDREGWFGKPVLLQKKNNIMSYHIIGFSSQTPVGICSLVGGLCTCDIHPCIPQPQGLSASATLWGGMFDS